MSEAVRLITTKREHLFDVSQTLCAAIPLEFLQDKDKPVVISVRGSINDGKKIFPDAAVEKLLGVPDARKADHYTGGKQKSLPFFEGRPEYDEYWTGQYKNLGMQITFINPLWQGGYSNPQGKTIVTNSFLAHDIAKNFIPLREKGGLSFIHNSDHIAKDGAWIDIWVEKKNSFILSPYESHLKKEEACFQSTFNALVPLDKNKDWMRYIQITVHKPELLQSSELMATINKMGQPDYIFKPSTIGTYTARKKRQATAFYYM